ncbi:MAG: low temperature requirement protein A [Intrasporangium sp.]|uniref:low temperature requirement protein A n=1 Tax=Intrasporangium sp. TaxID=1925024 RepID=UPI00264A4369|nr:low temperature requirement protein A [Intrasporangium sp.]MDN5796834.1 low temperature requirement protein A [Intrasporangium sp.]
MSVQPAVRREVSPLELFYDLVFVFAVSQLSHHLLEHLSWRGAAETAVMLVAVFGVWAATSFDVTALDVARSRTKVVLVVLMLLGLFMNAGITDAFGHTGWTFVVPLLVVLLGHNVVMALLAPTPVLRAHYARALVWAVATAPLWLLGAAAAPASRPAWWAAAALVELLGFWLAHPLPGRRLQSEHLDIDAEHMLERLRLFLIILFGETVLTIGRVISETPITVASAIASVGVLVALICLWGSYFGGAENIVATHLGSTTDPIRSIRLGANVTYGVLAGLVAVAVGSDLAIADPLGPGSVPLALLLCGGIVVYLASHAWFFGVVIRGAWLERVGAAAAVTVVGVAAVWLPPLVTVLVLDAVLVVTVLLLLRVQRMAGASATPGGSASLEAG